MKLIKKIIAIACTLSSASVLAHDPNPKLLTLTMVNNTDNVFVFTGATGTNPGNLFTASQNEIPPHQSIVIMGEITENFDLAGALHFKDAEKKDNELTLIDPRNFHMMQPLFHMNNKNYYGKLTSRETGDSSNPVALFISKATVEIDSH
jgi:hypothetical protein